MKTKTRKALVWICIVVVCVVALHTILVLITGARLRAAYAELKAAGRPMKSEAIIPAYIPDSENAACIYESAFALIKAELEVAGKEWKEPLEEVAAKIRKGELVPPEKDQAVREFLARQSVSRILRLLDEAASRKACNFNLDYSKGPGMLLPHIAAMRSASRLVAWKSCVDARDKNGEAAWDGLVLGLRMSDALHDEPILISQLVRIAQASIALGSLEYALDALPVEEGQYRRIDETLKPLEDEIPMVRAMDGERLLLGEWCWNLSRRGSWREVHDALESESSRGIALLNISFAGRPLMQADHAAYLRVMKRVAESFEQPYWRAEAERMRDWSGDVPKYCWLTRLLTPALHNCRQKQAAHFSGIRLARIALALKLHKAKNGAYPESLDKLDAALLPEQPVDEFTGKAFIYRRQGEGFIAYSVAENLKDDGGVRRSESSAKDWDFVWESRN